jgi:hypothetical protein
MPNISRGQLAVKWFETRHERKKEARQEPALTRRNTPVGPKFRWTPSADTALRSLWFTTDRTTIANILGCSPGTMYDRADVLGLPKTVTCPRKSSAYDKSRDFKARAISTLSTDCPVSAD